MHSNILITDPKPSSTNSKKLKSVNIFEEMETLGIDTTPFLEIAALDIIDQFGDAALYYSSAIEQKFIENDDLTSATIWAKISSHLSEIQFN